MDLLRTSKSCFRPVDTSLAVVGHGSFSDRRFLTGLRHRPHPLEARDRDRDLKMAGMSARSPQQSHVSAENLFGSSLFPMGEQTKPILSFGGIDRSWASSRDESLRERLRLIVSARGFLGPAHRRQVIAVCDQQTPPFTPETISRRAAPTFRHLAKLISGFLLKPCLQRIARSREQRPPSEVSEQSAHSRPVISALSAGDSRREIRRFRSECCGNFCPIR